MWDSDRTTPVPTGRHWLILHGPWNEEEDRPEWMEIEHEICQLQTHVYEEEIYEDPTPEELKDTGPWRELRPTGKTRLIFESHYESCPVDFELENGLDAFGTTYRFYHWIDFSGTRHDVTKWDLWPEELPRVPGRYEITNWCDYYPGEYGGIGDCDSGLRLVCSWYDLDGTRYDADGDSGPGWNGYHRYDYCHFLTGYRSWKPRESEKSLAKSPAKP